MTKYIGFLISFNYLGQAEFYIDFLLVKKIVALAGIDKNFKCLWNRATFKLLNSKESVI